METETLYRQLQEHLNRGIVPFPATRSGVEVRILQRLFTPEEASIALELSTIPEPLAAVHKRCKNRFSSDDLRDKLARMNEKGLILLMPMDGEVRYGKLPYVVGIYERQLGTLTADLERDTRQYIEEALASVVHTQKTTQMRVVPAIRKIPVERNTATYDEIRAHIEASPGPFAAIPCICRRGKALLGDTCRHTQTEASCLMIGPAANWAIGKAVGKELDRAGMLAMLEQADREGLVLQPENTKNPMFVCCCCSCCCNALNGIKRLPAPADRVGSGWSARVDEETCQACGVCIERCPMDAISNPEGTAVVDRARCIGCGLCVSTCPSEALRLEKKPDAPVPPDDTKGLYLRLFQERYGKWGMAKAGVRSRLGLKV